MKSAAKVSKFLELTILQPSFSIYTHGIIKKNTPIYILYSHVWDFLLSRVGVNFSTCGIRQEQEK